MQFQVGDLVFVDEDVYAHPGAPYQSEGFFAYVVRVLPAVEGYHIKRLDGDGRVLLVRRWYVAEARMFLTGPAGWHDGPVSVEELILATFR